MRTRRWGGIRSRLVLAATLVVALAPLGANARSTERTKPFTDAGFSGTGQATMQAVTTAARPARVAYVPGDPAGEAWGIGLSSSIVPGWHTDSPGGQVVFMQYLPSTGWQVNGPPVDFRGSIINPDLYGFAMAPGGEGWAVGADGTLLHRAKGGGVWRSPQAIGSTPVTTQDLRSVTLIGSGLSLTGYAVGDSGTILRLKNGVWAADSGAALVTDDLTAVAASSAENAWAVSGNSTKDLSIYRRTSSGWSKLATGDAIFDGPHPAKSSGSLLIRQASGASIAASQDGAWVGGVLYVTDASNAFGDDSGRPFTIHISTKSGAPDITSYCAPIYSQSGADASATPICDGSFPLSSYDVTSLNILPGGEVFAGGLGLFHFKRGQWVREPNTNGYLISMAFKSAKEGWVATTGSIYGAGGSAYSSQTTLGHWTTTPAVPRMARWPQPNQDTLEAVAESPAGTGEALAVGTNGSLLRFRNSIGWDTVARPTFLTFHGVTWQNATTAWAVGDHGLIARYSNGRWTPDPAAQTLTSAALFAVAFKGDTGFAVGAGGVILRYAGGRWRLDAKSGLTPNALYAITSTPSGFMAVGAKATVLDFGSGSWRYGANLARRITRPRFEPPALNAVITLPDGSIIIGGAQSALVRRPAGSQVFTQIPFPVDGTIVALGGSRNAMFASVSDSESKFIGSRLGAPATQVLALDTAGWHDIQLAAKQTVGVGLDPSQPADALYGVALDPSGTAGWAVGGTLVNTKDANGHVFSSPTSAVYRVDLQNDPSPRDDLFVPDLPSGYSFAFFGESGCQQGLCGATVGSGTSGDVISEQIQHDVNMLSKMKNGPQFVMFGGNMRNLGLPEELAQFRSYLKHFNVPAWSAIGDRDLFFGGSTRTGVQVGTGDSPLGSANKGNPSTSFYYSAFSAMPAPWGEGKPVSGFVPVYGPGGSGKKEGARTHYAFDVMDAGKKMFRMIVLDSSRKSLSSSDPANTAAQNPQEDQLTTFLPGVLDPAVPSIVVMNQPTLNPYYLGGGGTPNFTPTSSPDIVTFDGLVGTRGVTSVLQSGYPINVNYSPLDLAPGSKTKFYINGGGGRPGALTHNPLDGFYHSWYLVNVQGAGAAQTSTVTTMPVLDSLALHAKDGNVVGAGNVLEFSGLARFPLGGTSDQNQSKSSYLSIPVASACSGVGLQDGRCANRNAVLPTFEFHTSNPSIARFVKWDFGRGLPDKDLNNKLIPSVVSGFLCAIKPGHVNVFLRMGLKQATMPVDVGAGFGPCIDKPVKPEIIKPKPPVQPKPQPQPKSKPYLYFNGTTSSQAVALFPPIPAPILAPAPPGSPGVGRKEEHEVQTESEGHGEGADFTALELKPHTRDYRAVFTAVRTSAAANSTDPAWPLLGGVAGMAFMSAAFALSKRQRRPAWERDRRFR